VDLYGQGMHEFSLKKGRCSGSATPAPRKFRLSSFRDCGEKAEGERTKVSRIPKKNRIPATLHSGCPLGAELENRPHGSLSQFSTNSGQSENKSGEGCILAGKRRYLWSSPHLRCLSLMARGMKVRRESGYPESADLHRRSFSELQGDNGGMLKGVRKSLVENHVNHFANDSRLISIYTVFTLFLSTR